MGRKRPRMPADATDAAAFSMELSSLSVVMPPPPSPPLHQQYFSYIVAPEDNGHQRRTGVGEDDRSRYLIHPPMSRGRHQQEVDKVDIPAPTEWLCHDAAASARLRAQAQTELQLYIRRGQYNLPHSERQEHWLGDAGIRAAITSTLNYSTGRHASGYSSGYLRPERVIRGGEVLPWGSWPVRLRHHEGQCFYQEDGGEGVDGSVPFLYWVGGGGVGRSGGVGGVGVVSESSIHDELLRRRSPSSSSLSRCHEEVAVTRLVPDKRGRWVEVNPRRPPQTTAADAAAASTSDSGVSRSSLAPSPSSPAPPAASHSPAPSATEAEKVVKCLIPARYGGWVEFQENEQVRAQSTSRQKRQRRTAVALAARFGPDSGGDTSATGVVPDAALPSSYFEEEGYARRMVAATTTGEKRRQQEEEDAQQQQQRGARVNTMEQSDPGDGGEATVGAERGRKRRSSDIGADAGVGCGLGKTYRGHGDSDCRRQGWAVSEPAKETVRRVWNRARRRARDSFEPRHRAPEATGNDVEDTGAGAGAGAASYGTILDELDPDLLSCLGRECEGIVDAALHVVLDDRLRLLQPRSCSGLTGQDKQNNPPPPLGTADWQDVLRAMRNCSEGARASVTTAAVVHSNVAVAHGGGRKGGRIGAKRGGEGREGRGAMERAVWGAGGNSSDGSVVVVNERLPGLPLNEAVLTRAYNRLLQYLFEKKAWQA